MILMPYNWHIPFKAIIYYVSKLKLFQLTYLKCIDILIKRTYDFKISLSVVRAKSVQHAVIAAASNEAPT